MALITAAQARLYLPELTGTATDTDLDALIARFGAAAARWCGYPAASTGAAATLESASYVRYLAGSGGRLLRLDVWPVTAIASIYDDPALTWGADTLVAAADYGSAAHDANEGLVLLTETSTHAAWSTSPRAVKASFTAGFTTVPSDVVQAAVVGVKAWFSQRRNQGKSNASEDGLSIGLVDEAMLPPVARQLLAPYRLPGVL